MKLVQHARDHHDRVAALRAQPRQSTDGMCAPLYRARKFGREHIAQFNAQIVNLERPSKTQDQSPF
ncbi:hypothetical protein [Methylobacterium indicum]|uniref:hypothetical protein n=1 Tax=Methylobacterium indicum TaxID=1775910 RepID=UPI0024352423|nr:hypothetical protein [Methylobacterium indicum]